MEGVFFNLFPKNLMPTLTEMGRVELSTVNTSGSGEFDYQNGKENEIFSQLIASLLVHFKECQIESLKKDGGGLVEVSSVDSNEKIDNVCPNEGGEIIISPSKEISLKQIPVLESDVSQFLVDLSVGSKDIKSILVGDSKAHLEELRSEENIKVTQPSVFASGDIKLLLDEESSEGISEKIKEDFLRILARKFSQERERVGGKIEIATLPSNQSLVHNSEDDKTVRLAERSIESAFSTKLSCDVYRFAGKTAKDTQNNNEISKAFNLLDGIDDGVDNISSGSQSQYAEGSKENIEKLTAEILKLQGNSSRDSVKISGGSFKGEKKELGKSNEENLVLDISTGRRNEEMLGVKSVVRCSSGSLDDASIKGNYTKEILDKVIETVRFLRYGEIKSIVVKLRPECLGELDVKVNHHGGEVNIKLTTSTQDTQSMLLGNINQLKEFLKQDGVPVREIQVVFTGMWLETPNFNSSMNFQSRNNDEGVYPISSVEGEEPEIVSDGLNGKIYHSGNINYWA
ncbi:MAG: flagellar hook-length control protein FliK [Candidatus Hydrogenedentes bacterium]|nr:flagellar hook-length control protein FliK [Candidatus Hydrogenedentota bacterium]